MNSIAAKKAASAKDLLDEVRDLLIDAIPSLFDQNRDDIRTAIEVAVEDAQDKQAESEQPVQAKLNLSVAIKWNLDSRKVDFQMPVTIKRTAKVAKELDDPDQPQLPGVSDETTSAFVADRKRREVAASILRLPEENPELHRAAEKIMVEQGISYVDALHVLAHQKLDEKATEAGGPNA